MHSANAFLDELKRRRVIRALVGYGIAAFAVLQIIEPIMHGLHWPEAVLSYVVVALAVGFPIIVTLAWIFDVKAGRIERTAPAAPSSSLRGMRLMVVLLGIGLLAAAPGLTVYFFLLGGARGIAERRNTAASTPSIAVLPFVNMSGDKENEYFSDGITEELINALANVEGLRVIARTSVFALKGKDIGIRKIGEELNVATVLEGSVRREGSNLRVTAQLVSAADGYHIWSKVYDREVKSVFALEDELARSIAEALLPRLVRREPAPLVRPATASTAAHDTYLKGRYFWNQRTRPSVVKAMGLFQQALAEDPSYALAYAGLADCYSFLNEYGWATADEVLPKGQKAALRAVELDPNLGEAHLALGLISTHNYDWSTAEREFRRAIELNPRNATAHHWYALLLADEGRLAEARAEADRARQLDPTSFILQHLSGMLYYFARDYERAVEDVTKTLELEPRFQSARFWLARAYTQMGKYDEALAGLDASTERTAVWQGMRGYVLAVSGRRDAARQILAELTDRARREFIPATFVAAIHLGLGDADAAFAWLDKAYAARGARLRELKVDPTWDPLRPDPRFAQLLKQTHLD